MATTAQEVFDAAMALIDEVNESTGATDTADTKEYKNKTLLILNILRGEFQSVKNAVTGKMPRLIDDIDSNIDLEDYVCQTILPYGLAAHLMLDENPSTAGFFQQRYEELKRALGTGRASGSEDIVDVYGGLAPYNEFGYWG